jgi:hypothetical protein
MAERADIHFLPRPGTDLVWISAMSRYMFDNGHPKPEVLEKWVSGVTEFRTSLEPFTMEYASKICEIPLETLERVAREIATAESMCVLWAMGITQHTRASDKSTAVSNLLLVTGNHMRPGCGAYPLRGHNNVQGASDIGAMPDNYPGYQDVASLDRKCLGHKIGAKTRSPIRGIFDKETRRKPLALAADAAPMAFGSCFGTLGRSKIVGGTPKHLGSNADLAGKVAASSEWKEQGRAFCEPRRHQGAGVRAARPVPDLVLRGQEESKMAFREDSSAVVSRWTTSMREPHLGHCHDVGTCT